MQQYLYLGQIIVVVVPRQPWIKELKTDFAYCAH